MSALEGHQNQEPATSQLESSSESTEILTLFVSGFPNDVTYREVYNFFRFLPKFVFVSLDTKGRTPLAFVTFGNRAAALEAQRITTGLAYDLDEAHITLRVDFAKKNSVFKKRTRHDIEGVNAQEKRFRNESSYGQPVQPPYGGQAAQYGASPSPYGASGGYQQQGGGNPQQAFGGPPQRSFENPQEPFGMNQSYPQNSGFGEPSRQSWAQTSDPISYVQSFAAFHGHVTVPILPCGNPPCSTLFIANISRETSEAEFNEAFQGCQRLRFTPPREKGGPIVFVEYHTPEIATAVRDLMNGFRFKSAGTRGIKIEYAKKQMAPPSSRISDSYSYSGANSQPLGAPQY